MTNKASVHVSQPGNSNGLGDWLRNIANAGKPAPVVYSVNGNLRNTLASNSPTTKLIYRRQTETFNRLPQNFFNDDPATSATNWISKTTDSADQGRTLIQNWLLNPADWYDPLNEPVPGTVAQAQYLNTWMLTALNIAKANNLKLALFSFATGTPSMELWPYLYPALRLGTSQGAVLSLHEYSVDGTMQHGMAGNVLRYRDVYDSLPADCRPQIVITECGAGNGYDTGVSGQEWVNDLTWYNAQTCQDDYLLGFCAYQLGGQESNLVSTLPAYTTAIQGFTCAANPPDPIPAEESYSGEFSSSAFDLHEHGNTWTLQGAHQPAGYSIFKNGAQHGGGWAEAILYWHGVIYVTNAYAQWYSATPTGWTQVAGDPRLAPPPPAEKKLAVPWVGQNTSLTTDDYSNSDCGPASVTMWLKYRNVAVTVDDVSRATGKAAGYTYTVFADLDKAANVYGLDLTHQFGTLTLPMIRSEIDAGRPALALVDYPALPVKWDANYSASHWILLIGYGSGKFFYHDPYWPDNRGASITISDSQLTNALQQVTTDGNTPMQGATQAQTTPPPNPTGSALLGVHCRANGGDLPDVEQQAAQAVQVNVKGYKFMTGCSQSHYNSILSGLHYEPAKCMTRLFWDASGVPTLPTPGAFIEMMRAGIQDAWNVGIRSFELLNEVNLYQEWKSTWGGAAGFCDWALQVISMLRTSWAGIQIISPGLAPIGDLADIGEHTDRWINTFNQRGLFSACNYAGAHAYWGNRAGMTTTADGLNFRRYYNATIKNIWITECANNQATDSDEEKGRQYKDYIAYLRANDPRVERAYVYVLSSTTQGENDSRQTWVRNGKPSGIVTVLSS